MLDSKTKERIHEESQQFAKENYSHKCPVAYYYSRGAEAEATRAAGLISALNAARKALAGSYDVQNHPGDGSSGCDAAIKEIDEAIANYNNPVNK